MADLKRALSKKVKSTLSLSARKNTISNDSDLITPQASLKDYIHDDDKDQEICALKYDEIIDPLSSLHSNSLISESSPINNNITTPTSRTRASSTSLPALLKRSKSYISGNSNNNSNIRPPTNLNHLSSPNIYTNGITTSSISTTTTTTISTGQLSQRQSLSSISSPVNGSIRNDSLPQIPPSLQTLQQELQKVLISSNDEEITRRSSDVSNFKNELRLDLLPPNPGMKSPVSEAQLSPILPSRITSPILENGGFFNNGNNSLNKYTGDIQEEDEEDDDDENEEFNQQHLHHKSSSTDSLNQFYAHHYHPPKVNRSRHNSSVTSFSSHTTNVFAKNGTNHFFFESLNNNNNTDPIMNSLIFHNKDLIFNSEDLDDDENNELQDAFCDEIALNILDKVESDIDPLTNINPTNNKNNKFEFDEELRSKRQNDWLM